MASSLAMGIGPSGSSSSTSSRQVRCHFLCGAPHRKFYAQLPTMRSPRAGIAAARAKANREAKSLLHIVLGDAPADPLRVRQENRQWMFARLPQHPRWSRHKEIERYPRFLTASALAFGSAGIRIAPASSTAMQHSTSSHGLGGVAPSPCLSPSKRSWRSSPSTRHTAAAQVPSVARAPTSGRRCGISFSWRERMAP
jgi:hypothetical protein